MFSVVMIVRNEEAALPAALESVHGAPEVIVCDTGSTDMTRECARAAGARVVEFTWCDDFSAARAFAESQASYDWVMRLDADERIAPCGRQARPTQDATGIHSSVETIFVEAIATLLRQPTSASIEQVFIRRQHSAGNDHWFPRLHRRSRFRWVYPVHELVRPVDGRRPQAIALAGFVVTHDRDARPRPYRAILESVVRKQPDDPYLAFHLGQACFEEADWRAAVNAFARYQSLPGGYRFHRGEALRMEGEAWEKLGEYERAFDAYFRALKSEGRAEPLWQAAQLAIALGDHVRARSLVNEGEALAASPPREKQPFGAIDHPYVLDWRRYDQATWRWLAQRTTDAGEQISENFPR